jgi:hypothetical protein
MHAIWLLLLDEKFLQAYEHGMLVKCGDGIIRRVFPRLFTYSADYPERCACNCLFFRILISPTSCRVLLACIRFLAQAPCPACLIQKAHVAAMGSKQDMARRQHFRVDTSSVRHMISSTRSWIFERGYSTDSKMVGRVLDAMSLLPTQVRSIQ